MRKLPTTAQKDLINKPTKIITKIIKTTAHTDHMFIPIPLHISPICDEGE